MFSACSAQSCKSQRLTVNLTRLGLPGPELGRRGPWRPSPTPRTQWGPGVPCVEDASKQQLCPPASWYAVTQSPGGRSSQDSADHRARLDPAKQKAF